MKRSLNRMFHDSCEQHASKKCILHKNKYSQLSLQYEHMENIVTSIIETFNHCGISKMKNNFVAIIGNGLSIEAIALSIAIMDTGNAFVFFDTSNTIQNDLFNRLKITWILDERNTKFVDLPASKKLLRTFKVLGTEYDLWNCVCDEKYSNPEFQFAFAVMSSGSTGDPKIIKVPHESIVPNIIDLKEIYQLQPNDLVLVTTPFTFDPCIVDLFLAFYSGASVLLPSNDMKFDTEFLSKSFIKEEYGATLWFTTPSIFMKCYPKHIQQCSLKILVLGGEQFPDLNVNDWSSLKALKVYNIYGTTEVSCWASIHLVDDFSKPASLGNVLSDTIFEIRNNSNNSGEISVDVGELYIGSTCRKCVVNDDYDTFAQDLLFRPTGDLVKVVNGQYYYVGRKDRRVKLYGHIVDLSTIETAISRYPFVKSCCCIFIDKENKIIAFVELINDNFNSNDLEKSLRTDLPSVMVPSPIYVKNIPINRHGKICEKSCAELYHEMKSCSENLMSEFSRLWIRYTANDLVGSSSVGFIESGGNSILALQFTAALSELCKVPNNFIAFLLSNKTYDECFQLVKSAFEGKTVNYKNAEVSSAGVENVASSYDEEISSKPKKLKITDLGKMLFVKSRNHTKYCPDAKNENKMFKINEMKVKWKYNLEKCVDASPIVVVYKNFAAVICGSHSGQLVALDLKSSGIILQIKLPDRIESSAAVSQCGKFLFIGCYDKKLYCININENSIQWCYETEEIVKSTPVVSDCRLYFGSYDHNFYCISSETGILIWKTNIDDSSIYATPSVSEQIIVTTLGGTLAVLNLDGSIKHSRKYGKPFFSSPLKLPNREECIVIDVTGAMRLFSLDTGREIWEYQINGNVFSSISIVESSKLRITFGCHDRNIYCFEILQQAPLLIWRKELDATIYSTPFCFGNQVSGNFYSYCNIVVSSTSGNIYVIDSDSGNTILNYSSFGSIFSSPVVHESYIVVGCRDNYLYCFEMS